MEIPQRCEFPHLHDFLVRKSAEAVQKRTDRELIEQFGKIEEQIEEDIWQMEQKMRR